VLAEDAIQAAIGDWKKKHGVEVPVHEKRRRTKLCKVAIARASV